MIKNCSIKMTGFRTLIQVGRRTGSKYKVREYHLHRLTESSVKRLTKFVCGNISQKHVEFDESDLTPTVYFSYGQSRVEQVEVGKSVLYSSNPDHEISATEPVIEKLTTKEITAIRAAIWGGYCD